MAKTASGLKAQRSEKGREIITEPQKQSLKHP